MNPAKTPHEWSEQSLLNKAQRYATLMLAQERESWLFGFWSALTLEMLARAALAKISPTLVAESKDWNNIYYALGNQPPTAKFSPKSASTSDLLTRAQHVFPDFTKEMLSFSILHTGRRNSELHSGSLPFDALPTSQWLAEFYLTCEALLKTLEKKLTFLFGISESKTAKILIKALKDHAAKAVQQTISAHTTIWNTKSKKERGKLAKKAEMYSARHLGHIVKCPSCGSAALLTGSQMGPPNVSVKDQRVIVKSPMLPSYFSCSACSLKISGYSKLNACGLGDSFTSTSYYDAADYFAPTLHDEWEGIEEDNNEP